MLRIFVGQGFVQDSSLLHEDWADSWLEMVGTIYRRLWFWQSVGFLSFSPWCLLGLKGPRWFLHFHVWSLGGSGWSSLGWQLAVLPLHGIFLLCLVLPHSMEVPWLSVTHGIGFSQRRAMVEAARSLWPCQRSSRTLLLLNSIVRASHGLLKFRRLDIRPTFLMGGKAKNLWSSLIYHRRLTGRFS